jgi:hypothetical protein
MTSPTSKYGNMELTTMLAPVRDFNFPAGSGTWLWSAFGWLGPRQPLYKRVPSFSVHFQLILILESELVKLYRGEEPTTRRTNHDQLPNPPLPEYRRPTQCQIQQMLPGARNRLRLDRNPFRAMHLLVKRNPDSTYMQALLYLTFRSETPDSKSTATILTTSTPQIVNPSSWLRSPIPSHLIVLFSTRDPTVMQLIQVGGARMKTVRQLQSSVL